MRSVSAGHPRLIEVFDDGDQWNLGRDPERSHAPDRRAVEPAGRGGGDRRLRLAWASPPARLRPRTTRTLCEVGRAYLPGLGKAYAAAWEEGAKSLEAGQPLSAAIAAVGKAWDANRTQLFDQLATPEFAKIVPESQKDADVTPQQRAAMAAAWRGLALGLGK